MNDFAICSVFILEIPSADDIYHCVSEAQHICEIVDLNGFECNSRCAIDRYAFDRAIDEYTNAVGESSECPPILHISAHGSQDGIDLPDGDEVSWKQLQSSLMPANRNTSDGIVICFSCCEGLKCEQILVHSNDGEKPFRAIIASGDEPTWSETAVGFSAFYHRLANGSSVADAVNALRVASGNGTFIHVCCESARLAMDKIAAGVPSHKIVESFQASGALE